MVLLFLRLLLNTLIKWGFKLNEHNKCMANKRINRWQCTIIWNVDDLKVSHIDKMVVEDIITQLNNKFRNECLLTTPSKVLEYLVDYMTKGKVKYSCINAWTKC